MVIFLAMVDFIFMMVRIVMINIDIKLIIKKLYLGQVTKLII